MNARLSDEGGGRYGSLIEERVVWAATVWCVGWLCFCYSYAESVVPLWAVAVVVVGLVRLDHIYLGLSE